MQNRYVGDIGDFGKYYILKALCLGPQEKDNLSLGVVWYLVPDEGHSADGKHIGYLQEGTQNLVCFRSGDPELYDKLRLLVTQGDRCVSSVKRAAVLPSTTRFYEAPLSFETVSSARHNRELHRASWLKAALDATQDCELVFLDPDNGLEVSSVLCHHKTGPKYAYYQERQDFIDRDQSLVIYQHANRRGSTEQQVSDRRSELKAKLKVDDVYSVVFRRGTVRVFFVIPSPRHKEQLRARLDRATQVGPWMKHFTDLKT